MNSLSVRAERSDLPLSLASISPEPVMRLDGILHNRGPLSDSAGRTPAPSDKPDYVISEQAARQALHSGSKTIIPCQTTTYSDFILPDYLLQQAG
jgi:hypothetical protein